MTRHTGNLKERRGSRPTVREEVEPQLYNHKELNLTNNLNEPVGRFFPRDFSQEQNSVDKLIPESGDPEDSGLPSPRISEHRIMMISECSFKLLKVWQSVTSNRKVIDELFKS